MASVDANTTNASNASSAQHSSASLRRRKAGQISRSVPDGAVVGSRNPKRSRKPAPSKPSHIDLAALKEGDIVSSVVHYCVLGKSDPDNPRKIYLRGSDNRSVEADAVLLKTKGYKCSSQYATTEKLCRAKIIDVIEHTHGHSFFADFDTQDTKHRLAFGAYLKTTKDGYIHIMELDGANGDVIEQFCVVDTRKIHRIVFNGVQYISTSKIV